MKTVILFGGGDGGGLIITEHGVRSIPPFDKATRLNLKAAAAAVSALAATRPGEAQPKFSQLATRLCNLAAEQVEQVVGPLEGDRSLVFQDDDGGFTCGSGGKPAIPIPWPPRLRPSFQDLMAAGVVEPDVVDFLRRALTKKVPLGEVFEDPMGAAKKLGVPLSRQAEDDLKILAPSRLDMIADETERQIVGFFQKVAQDGRYLDTWFSRPFEVARELQIKLSDPALEWLVTGGAPLPTPIKEIPTEIKAGIAWGIVCIIIGVVCMERSPIDEVVHDRSGLAKM